MLEASPQAKDLIAQGYCRASGSHPVAPTGGSYVVVDLAPQLAASAPGPIFPVLVLPADESAALFQPTTAEFPVRAL